MFLLKKCAKGAQAFEAAYLRDTSQRHISVLRVAHHFHRFVQPTGVYQLVERSIYILPDNLPEIGAIGTQHLAHFVVAEFGVFIYFVPFEQDEQVFFQYSEKQAV